MAAFFSKIQNSLKKTREGVFSKINRVFTAKRSIDDDLLEEIEEILIGGDVGVETSLYLIDHIKNRVRSEKYQDSSELETLIRDEISALLLDPVEGQTVTGPRVMLFVGVNGTGKTTSIAKIANRLKSQGHSVLLAAADTFRAAAIEQLSEWARRIGVDVIKHQANADPSAVVYDAMNAAIARKSDYLLIDTAGRLHTKANLMAELNKIFRVIQKITPDAPHEVIMVLDASTGQNAVNQAREFKNTARVDSIFLAKLDGTARGGEVLAINKELAIPVRYIGVGEKVDDIEVFNKNAFVEGLFYKE